jgi:hypothetical protein
VSEKNEQNLNEIVAAVVQTRGPINFGEAHTAASRLVPYRLGNDMFADAVIQLIQAGRVRRTGGSACMLEAVVVPWAKKVVDPNIERLTEKDYKEESRHALRGGLYDGCELRQYVSLNSGETAFALVGPQGHLIRFLRSVGLSDLLRR